METPTIESGSGLRWELAGTGSGGYGLGRLTFRGRDLAPPASRAVALRNVATGERTLVAASSAERLDGFTIRLRGAAAVEGGRLSFEATVSVRDDVPAAGLEVTWRTDADLTGWELCLAYQEAFDRRWRCNLYPFAEDEAFVSEAPLTYVGVPAALMHTPDWSTAVLFGIDPSFDYLDPTSWTGDVAFHFADGVTPPEFRIGGRGMRAGEHRLALQLLVTAEDSSTAAVTRLVRDWSALNGYRVEPLQVRTPDEALAIFLEGRRKTSAWQPGIGYQLEEGDPDSDVVYIGENPLSAYFEYLVFERTGDHLWRDRSLEQLDAVLRGQERDPDHRHFGAIHTSFDLRKRAFDSDDRGANVGYKPDLVAHIARYLLLTWERMRNHEGLDRRDWYDAALRAADWVLRQQNPDGGLPQCVDIETGRRSVSHTAGRALPAVLAIARITGEPRYVAFAGELERHLREVVEARMRFTGHHPDLPPDELEEASVWGAIEYWLDTYQRTGEAARLERAVADASLALLWWCPKQLPWVKNPTQCASAEQQHFLQYSVYCYQNRKIECLERLARHTGDALWHELAERVLQGILWTQVTEGDQMGATHERIADPWLARDEDGGAGFDSLGTMYIGEQSLDAMLQLVEMGWATPAA
jgi:hypothetical protein